MYIVAVTILIVAILVIYMLVVKAGPRPIYYPTILKTADLKAREEEAARAAAANEVTEKERMFQTYFPSIPNEIKMDYPLKPIGCCPPSREMSKDLPIANIPFAMPRTRFPTYNNHLKNDVLFIYIYKQMSYPFLNDLYSILKHIETYPLNIVVPETPSEDWPSDEEDGPTSYIVYDHFKWVIEVKAGDKIIIRNITIIQIIYDTNGDTFYMRETVLHPILMWI